VNGQRNDLNGIGVRWRGRRAGDGQRPSFFQKQLSEVFHRTGNHQPSVGQIESLSDGPGKIKGLGNHHFAGGPRKVEGHMIAEHTYMVLQGNRKTVGTGGVKIGEGYRWEACVSTAVGSQQEV